jgi:hypothetical protein
MMDDDEGGAVGRMFFCNPTLFVIELCKKRIQKKKTRIQWHVEECSIALLCKLSIQGLLCSLGMKLTN